MAGSKNLIEFRKGNDNNDNNIYNVQGLCKFNSIDDELMLTWISIVIGLTFLADLAWFILIKKLMKFIA